MRVALGPDSALKRAGLALRKVPKPAAYTFGGMAVARILGVAQRLGIFAALAGEPLDADALAARLGLASSPTRMALDVLVGERVLARQGDRYVLGPDGRPWLDPSSPTYIGTYIEHTVDYWTWWGEIEGSSAAATPSPFTVSPLGDPGWERYIRGQYELARLSATAVAKAIPLRGTTRRCSTSAAATACSPRRCAGATRACGRRSSTCPVRWPWAAPSPQRPGTPTWSPSPRGTCSPPTWGMPTTPSCAARSSITSEMTRSARC